MGVQQNKYIRWLAQKNTFVFLPGECELFQMKAGEEKWLTVAGDVAGKEKDGEG